MPRISYTQQYSQLAGHLSLPNFEALATVIENNFSDLFKLSDLEFTYTCSQTTKRSYRELFEKCIQGVDTCYTEDSIIARIEDNLNSSNVREYIKDTYIFVPDNNASQIGLLEKYSTGHLSSADPLTRLDLIRALRGGDIQSNQFGIYTLANLNRKDDSSCLINTANFRNKSFYLVNLSLNKNPLPKWAVVRKVNQGRNSNQSYQVYCEATILDSEKRVLESILNSSAEVSNFASAATNVNPNVEYLGGISALSPSTGYTALAWINQTYGHFSEEMTFNSDFYALVQSLIGIYDNYKSRMRYESDEYNAFTTPSFRTVNPAYPFYRVTRSCILGIAEDNFEIPVNNLCRALQVISQNFEDKRRLDAILDKYLFINARSFTIGLDTVLAECGVLIEDAVSTSLIIDENLDFDILDTAFATIKNRLTNVSNDSLRNLKRDRANADPTVASYYSDSQLHQADKPTKVEVATAAVCAVFRSGAKKATLNIGLPNTYRMLPDELDLVIRLMEGNPYVTQFNVIQTLGNENESLITLKQHLSPIFARNRWLARFGYHPAMTGDYWGEACRYWFNYLNTNPDILNSKTDQTFFQDCVREMSVEGLRHFLKFISNNTYQSEEISPNAQKPVFYGACISNHQFDHYPEYLDELTQHLRSNKPFPFSGFAIDYKVGHDREFLALINEIQLYNANNEDNSIAKITLLKGFECAQAFEDFLGTLKDNARRLNWMTLIEVPGLEVTDKVIDLNRALQVRHQDLNDNILNNVRVQRQGVELAKINEVFSKGGKLEYQTVKANSQTKLNQEEKIRKALNAIDDGVTYPIQRGSNEANLEIHQQQNIEQSYKQEHKITTKTAKPIPEREIIRPVLTYDTIDAVLGQFYQEFIDKNGPIFHQEFLRKLQQESETPLQHIFRTTIGANPRVVSPYVIQSMTRDAAEEVIRNYRRLIPHGLTYGTEQAYDANLPRGFQTTRAKDGSLVLCFNAQEGYSNQPDPLTIDLTYQQPSLTSWSGSFKRLNWELLSAEGAERNPDYWNYMTLFYFLQPVKDYTDEYNQWRTKQKGIVLSPQEIAHLKKYWPMYAIIKETKSNEEFIKIVHNYKDKAFDFEQAKKLFFQQIPLELRAFANEYVVQLDSNEKDKGKIALAEKNLRALGQVYYRFGNEGVVSLLKLFAYLEQSLGAEFFLVFKQSVLDLTDNYTIFMSESFFADMLTMAADLNKNAVMHKLFMRVLQQQSRIVGWEHPQKLWNGFRYFFSELSKHDLLLTGDEFDKIEEMNTFAAMHRILKQLSRIPRADDKQTFINHLDEYSLAHGDEYHALMYEGFDSTNKELYLNNFFEGHPTYAPNLGNYGEWSQGTFQVRRLLASHPGLTYETSVALQEYFGPKSRITMQTHGHQLFWLFHLKYNPTQLKAALVQLNQVAPDIQKTVANWIKKAVYDKGNTHFSVNFDTMRALCSLLGTDDVVTQSIENSQEFIEEHFADGAFWEALDILVQVRGIDATADSLISLTALTEQLQSQHYNRTDLDFCYSAGFKLLALFGRNAEFNALDALYNIISSIRPERKTVVERELQLLFKQLFSIDFDAIAQPVWANFHNDPNAWGVLLQTIHNMIQDPHHTAEHRIEMMQYLTQTKRLVFKYSQKGDFRALNDDDIDKPMDLNFFGSNERGIWQFMLDHIVIPNDSPARTELEPLMQFFKRLQASETYFDDVQQLLSAVKNIEPSRYWTAEYFYQLLKSIEVDEDNKNRSFPIALFKTILKESSIAAKPMQSIELKFPEELGMMLNTILKTSLTRTQQTKLCQVALRDYNWESHLLDNILTLLLTPEFAKNRDFVLNALVKCDTRRKLESQFNDCSRLINLERAPLLNDTWADTVSIWLSAIQAAKEMDQELTIEEKLFRTIQNKNDMNQDLILHIIAWSTLNKGLKREEVRRDELERKAKKLVERLFLLNRDDLMMLAHCYPRTPSPSASDILAIIKNSDKQSISFHESLNQFLSSPDLSPRADYGSISTIRQADLERMILSTRVSRGTEKVSLSLQEAGRINVIFAYLKRIEQGENFAGLDAPISSLTQEKLRIAYGRFSDKLKNDPNNDQYRALLWAVMFEALARTTLPHKYPHLAQQFALITNDINVHADTSVLQLSTGEGKSHYVALRAAFHAGQGKAVDVCTAKRTLADRDLEDYKNFYDYLGLTSACIGPATDRDTFIKTQIHYSTLADLSLFLDNQSYEGTPVIMDKATRVALFDEFDYIRFDKTEFNFAKHSGFLPKQVIWFYDAINDFYDDKKPEVINKALLKEFYEYLYQKAGENLIKEDYINLLTENPLEAVRWLQSAHSASNLEKGKQYTVIPVDLEIESESYPIKEIIPLSACQKMFGATFSSGVHQLVAARRNREEHEAGNQPDYHVPLESRILSSQIASRRISELWQYWEGYTGTVSPAQAAELYEENKTEVLHVATNRLDLRHWNAPQFFESAEDRLNAIVQKTNECLEKKQSILYAAKDDTKVLQMAQDLKGKLNVNDQFIFYYNDSPENEREILLKKEEIENWTNNQKERGVLFSASGFGRGDNVNVENVFLTDVGEINELLQKGGRTGRNGEAGEVHQFYVISELREEYDAYMSDLRAHDISDLSALEQITEGSENEILLQKLMMLREYVGRLKNEANHGFQDTVSQLTSWNMRILGQIIEPSERAIYTTHFALQREELDKHWTSISSEKLSTQEKIARIRDVAIHLSKLTLDRLKGDKKVVPLELKLKPFTTGAIKLIANTISPETSQDRAISVITSHLGCLVNASQNLFDDSYYEMLKIIEKDDLVLQQFSESLHEIKSLDEWIKRVTVISNNLKNKDNNSPAQQFLSAMQPQGEITDDDRTNSLLALPASVKESLMKSLNNLTLTNEVQNKAMEYLHAQKSLKSLRHLAASLPYILDYLACLSEEEQLSYIDDYLKKVDVLTRAIPVAYRDQWIQSRKAMPVNDMVALMNFINDLAQRYDLQETDKSRYTNLVEQAITIKSDYINAGESRRYLEFWNSWVMNSHLDSEQQHHFLEKFLLVLIKSKDNKHLWNKFTRLVNKTNDWWTKSGLTQEQLYQFWSSLADVSNDLDLYDNLMDTILSMKGKEWFMVPASILSNLHQNISVVHQDQLMGVWSVLANTQDKKRNKLNRLDSCCKSFQAYYNHDEAIFEGLLAFSHDDLAKNADKLESIMQYIDEYPVLLGGFNACLDANNLQLSRAEQLLKLFYDNIELLDNNNYEHLIPGYPETINSFFNELNDAQFEAIINLMSTQFKHIVSEPTLLPLLLGLVKRYHTEAASDIMQALFEAVEQTPHFPLDQFVQGFRNAFLSVRSDDLGVRARQEGVQRTLLDLLKRKDLVPYAPELLFDGTASFLFQNEINANTAYVPQILSNFYRCNRLSQNTIDDFFADVHIKNLLVDDWNNIENTKQRLLLMRLLFTSSLVNNVVEPSFLGKLPRERNTLLLDRCFEKYVLRASELLKSTPFNFSLHRVRGLTPSVQTGLLELIRELRLIRRPATRNTFEVTPKNAASLTTQLNTLMDNYQGGWLKPDSWFKSNARIQQLNDLRATVDQAMTEEIPRENRNRNRYESVLSVIATIRREALTADIQSNRTRSTWFKLNRSGESRFLNTLNQMEEMVISHWSKDKNAIERFTEYEQYNLRSLQTVSQQFVVALQDQYFKADGQFITNQWSLFSQGMQEGQVNQLIGSCQNLFRPQALRTPLELNDNIADELINALKQHLNKLPNHLKATARDILGRGEAIVNDLDNQRALS